MFWKESIEGDSLCAKFNFKYCNNGWDLTENYKKFMKGKEYFFYEKEEAA